MARIPVQDGLERSGRLGRALLRFQHGVSIRFLRWTEKVRQEEKSMKQLIDQKISSPHISSIPKYLTQLLDESKIINLYFENKN